MNYSTLTQTLERLAALRRPRPLMSPSGQYLSADLEARPAGEAYHWDGLRRYVNPARPYIVFQYTLAGWGVYEENGAAKRLLPGEAFAAYVPSAHIYRLPPDSPGWTFFWVMFNHPFVVARCAEVKAASVAVTTLAPDSLAVARLVHLFEGVFQGGFRDEWEQEQALFEFLWEYERHEHDRRYAPPFREQLLAEVRREVLAALEHTPDVAQLARSRGMSRSHFSHHFRAVTGLPPSQFVTQIRLEEVSRRLLETAHTLEVIAAATGFADSKHLCKVFRRHYHLSPGAFRRQMRPTGLPGRERN